MSKKGREAEYRRRLDTVLAEFETPPLRLTDKEGKPLTQLEVTGPYFESSVRRGVYVVEKVGLAKPLYYFINYDEVTRLSKEFMEEQQNLKVATISNGFFEYKGDFYNARGYLVVEKGDIIKINDEYFFTNDANTRDFSQKKPYMPEVADNLYEVNGVIYQKEGDLYYTYPNREAIFKEMTRKTIGSEKKATYQYDVDKQQPVEKLQNVKLPPVEAYEVRPLKNKAIKQIDQLELEKSRRNVDFILEPDPVNPPDSERSFRIQMDLPQLAAIYQKTTEVTLTSYHPTTGEPVDTIKVVLRREKNSDTYLSEPLALVDSRKNAMNGARGDQLTAMAGSPLVVSYPSIEGEEVTLPIGTVPVEKIQPVEVVIYKDLDGDSEINFQYAKSQLDQLAKELAPLGIQVKAKIHLVETPLDMDYTAPEKIAADAKKHTTDSKAITIVVGAKNHGDFFSTVDAKVPKEVQNTLFLDRIEKDQEFKKGYFVYGAPELVPQMMLLSAGYLKPGEEHGYSLYMPALNRLPYYHNSPTLVEPPKPQTVIDPFTGKAAVALTP